MDFLLEHYFPEEIVEKIILSISRCTTYNASNVCKEWFQIFMRNKLCIMGNDGNFTYDSFLSNKILINDTFALFHFLTQMCKNRNINVFTQAVFKTIKLKEVHNELCIKRLCKLGYRIPSCLSQLIIYICNINNKSCINYLCYLMTIHNIKSDYTQQLLRHICRINNEFPIKLFKDNYDKIDRNNKDNLLKIALINQSFKSIKPLISENYRIDGWIDYIINNWETDHTKIIITLYYLVEIHGINLLYLQERLLNFCDPLVEFIEETYF